MSIFALWLLMIGISSLFVCHRLYSEIPRVGVGIMAVVSLVGGLALSPWFIKLLVILVVLGMNQEKKKYFS